jgi:hypothetical protein
LHSTYVESWNPGWKNVRIWIRDEKMFGSGIKHPDPQHSAKL